MYGGCVLLDHGLLCAYNETSDPIQNWFVIWTSLGPSCVVLGIFTIGNGNETRIIPFEIPT